MLISVKKKKKKEQNMNVLYEITDLQILTF